MKFLDANGLARFTQKLFSKFISGVTGENNVITVTKGDGTKNTIDLNAVQKTDTLSKDPPDDDNSQKIATTSWVQKLVAVMVFKLIAKLAGTTETGVSSSGSFLGVHWLIAQNGYIAFGPFFGNLILQWGYANINHAYTGNGTPSVISLNISPKNLFGIWLLDNDAGCDALAAIGVNGNSFKAWCRNYDNVPFDSTGVQWFAICRG